MSDVCRLEHVGKMKLDNNSWNHNDSEGEEVANYVIIAVVFLILFWLCFIITCCLRRRWCKIFFAVLTITMLSTFLAFAIQSGEKIQAKPIVGVYALSQYITKCVRTNPRLNPDDIFPGHVEFESNFAQIRHEVLALAEHEEAWPLTKTTFGSYNVGIGNDIKVDEKSGKEIGWRLFTVSVGDQFTPRAEELLPKLTALIKKYRDQMVSCAISVLPPSVGIPPHVGYSKSVIRYMLPIEVPTETGCFLCLNGESQNWEVGKSFAFDDTFTHSVHNDTTQRRIVLYCDIIREVHNRPLLTKLSKFVFKHFIQKSQAVKDELARTEYLVPSATTGIPTTHENVPVVLESTSRPIVPTSSTTTTTSLF